MAKSVPVTRKKLKELRSELEERRTVKRKDAANEIQRASAIGGTVDNAAYDEAKREQSLNESRIHELERIINNYVIIERPKNVDKVVVGSSVTVLNQQSGRKEKYQIVGSPEANPMDGKISNVSPIGKALINRKVGETANVAAPAGVIALEVLEIK